MQVNQNVVSSPIASDSLNKTAAKIISFSKLPIGWCYGRGTPINTKTIFEALDYLSLIYANGIPETNAFPGVNGEIAVTGYHGAHYISVSLEINGKVDVLHEQDGVDLSDKEGLTHSEAQAELASILNNIEASCISSDWFIPTPMMQSVASFTVMHSRTTVQTGMLPFSTRTAPYRIADPSTNIFANSIEASLGNLLYSGALIRAA